MPKGIYNHKLIHKTNCSCCICKAIRGETKGENSYWYGKHHSEETCKKIGIGNTGKHHKSDCQCMTCKAKRGEYKGDKNPMFGKSSFKLHKPNCCCGVCKATRGETKGVYAPTYRKHWFLSEEIIKKMIETRKGKKIIHKLNCCCAICKAKRGENKGENSFSWLGGLSNFPYPFDFNNELKELIRKRDDYTCQLCNKTQEEEDKKLAVHHIDYIKENLDPDNLLTLCGSCNSKVNGNRKNWIEFFNNLIRSK